MGDRKVLQEGFLWGVSSSAFQFEMGDRYRRFIDTRSDWWSWVRDPKNISEGRVSGDLPEDGVDYAELYKRDHELAQRLGLKIYRISVEWSRIFPCPTSSVEVDVERDSLGLISSVKIGEDQLRELDGIANNYYVDFYRRIISDLRSRGFKVIVNLHHFTTPIWLHDPLAVRDRGAQGGPLGIASEDFVVEFAKYAAYVAWKLGDLVDMWSTFNEPLVNVELGFLAPWAGFPPGILDPEAARRAFSNIVVAHARAYDQIKKWDRVKADTGSRGAAEVGIIHNIIPAYPLGEGDEESADYYDYFHNRYILEAVTRGAYDGDMDGEPDGRQGHLAGRLDWFGLNYYTRVVTRRSEQKYSELPVVRFEGVSGYGYSCVPNGVSKASRPCSDFGWELYPEGLLKAIEVASDYGRPIYVTENGVADVRDVLRPYYIVSHVAAVEKKASEGADVRAYMHWALTDNYEWASGFRLKFGLYEVDLITKDRIPRKSVEVYKNIVASNGLNGELVENYLKAFHLRESLGV